MNHLKVIDKVTVHLNEKRDVYGIRIDSTTVSRLTVEKTFEVGFGRRKTEKHLYPNCILNRRP